MSVTAFHCGGSHGWSQATDVMQVDGGIHLRGPNAADFLLSFHAGRIVASGEADEITIVSGDSGMAATAQAIRSMGVSVYAVIPAGSDGYGRGASAGADVSLLLPHEAPPAVVAMAGVEGRVAEFAAALSRFPQDVSGWVTLAAFGTSPALPSLRRVGDPIKLHSLLKSFPAFELRGVGSSMAVRLKPGYRFDREQGEGSLDKQSAPELTLSRAAFDGDKSASQQTGADADTPDPCETGDEAALCDRFEPRHTMIL